MYCSFVPLCGGSVGSLIGVPFYIGAGNMSSENRLIVEYEQLRWLLEVLDSQVNVIDARLIEIENELPDSYVFPGDPPLGEC
jgi:hypothetical protein